MSSKGLSILLDNTVIHPGQSFSGRVEADDLAHATAVKIVLKAVSSVTIMGKPRWQAAQMVNAGNGGVSLPRSTDPTNQC